MQFSFRQKNQRQQRVVYLCFMVRNMFAVDCEYRCQRKINRNLRNIIHKSNVLAHMSWAASVSRCIFSNFPYLLQALYHAPHRRTYTRHDPMYKHCSYILHTFCRRSGVFSDASTGWNDDDDDDTTLAQTTPKLSAASDAVVIHSRNRQNEEGKKKCELRDTRKKKERKICK